jgi:hypothetical protein
MLVLSGTPTIKANSIIPKWSNARMSTDSETHLMLTIDYLQEKFEDAKGVIKSRKSNV